MNFAIGMSDTDSKSTNTTPSPNRSSATAKQWKIEHEAIVAERTRRILHGSTTRSTSGAGDLGHPSVADEESGIWRAARSEGRDESATSLETPGAQSDEMSREAMVSVDIEAWRDEVQRETATDLGAISAQGSGETKMEQSDIRGSRASTEDAGSQGLHHMRNNEGSKAVDSGYSSSPGVSSHWNDATGGEGYLGTTNTTINSNDSETNMSIESSTPSGPTTPLLKRAFASCWNSLKSGIGLLNKPSVMEPSDFCVVAGVENLHIGEGVGMPGTYGSDHGDEDSSQDGHNVWQNDDDALDINTNPTSSVWRSGSRLERGVHLA
ncbi:uncharacterized protein AB675_8965 [Cyphellophora attinorum]|uniref:Uncharacterized protein n=1 Tax=Cyphellophora attinorum TaxID=1664694 RepID=A0A0N1NYK4_9EURO|nr:uncharacterized protein AB675_8965 [Phialophora attinorum]KPI36167.1 hypothetical protein AB675_8965 [Phialophora attinorum]